MKNYYENAISFDRLYKGLKQSCRNVRWKDSVIGYEANGLINTLTLMDDLHNGTYKISKYQIFHIHEPKEREIVATRIRDRQFQRSLCTSGLYDDICEHFIRDNAACQIGKGMDDALNRTKVHLWKFYRAHGKDGWILKCDIQHFFQETRHDVAKAAVQKYVSDPRAAKAVFNVIDSFDSGKGIGLGSQISQLIQLLVLTDLDHFIKERLRVKHYIRYMDDFILIHENKEYLKYCLTEIEKQLLQIGLRLNRKTTIQPIRHGVWFLKWRFVLTDSGKVLMLIDRNKVTKQKARIRKLLRMEANGKLPPGTAQFSMECWIANAKRGNARNAIAEITQFYKEVRSEMDGPKISPEETDGICSGEFSID